MKLRIALIAAAILPVCALFAYAFTAHVNIQTGDGQRCIVSNGLPDHPTGQFPNSGNPNKIAKQNTQFCVTAMPEKGNVLQEVRTVGIAENGVIIRPGTADYYDASSPRGFSRDDSSGWNLDGMGARDALGLDDNNAHVDHRGLYHYHGAPAPVIETSDDTRIGWAADGFEIHYVGDTARPSYQLKPGIRPTQPGGAHDGTYNEDFEYIRGLGNLDQCNGADLNGSYVYFATDGYPYFPRCLYGTDIFRFR